MVARSPESRSRKSAPRKVQESATGSAHSLLSIEERAESALKARAYGSNPAPEVVSASFWERECAELLRFDIEHAPKIIELHDHFRSLYDNAYDRCYPRSVHADWVALRDLVRKLGPAHAYVAIDRCFDEAALVEVGIESVQIVVNWAHAVLRSRTRGGRSHRPRTRLTREEEAILLAVVNEHAAVLS